MLISRRELMLSESKQMNSIPICGMHSNSIFRSFYIYISTILRTTYDPLNILKTLLKAKKKKKKSRCTKYYKIFNENQKKKKKNYRITIITTPYQSWPIRSEDSEEDGFNGAHNRTDP